MIIRRYSLSLCNSLRPSVSAACQHHLATTSSSGGVQSDSSDAPSQGAQGAQTSGESPRPLNELQLHEIAKKLIHNQQLQTHGDRSYLIGMVAELESQQERHLELLLAKRRLEQRQRLQVYPIRGSAAEYLRSSPAKK